MMSYGVYEMYKVKYMITDHGASRNEIVRLAKYYLVYSFRKIVGLGA